MSEVCDTPELRLGRWQDVLADVECDALISDPPYSARTHEGMKSLPGASTQLETVRYDCWADDKASTFVRHWSPRTRSWMVIITDHVLARVIESELAAAGRYVFAPIPFVEIGKQPRMTGDGPASWTCWIVVARPKERRFSSWGSLPGAYVPPSGLGVQQDRLIKGGKPLWLMQALVRDYSRPGDVVCDPCAGGGTTLLAAAVEGRRAVGAEMDPATYEIARKRLARGYTPTMFP